jgi:DNA/RNA endonuclease G (NUC1)
MSSRLRKLSSHSIAALLGGAVTSLSLSHNMNIHEDYSKVIHGVLNFMNDLDHISNNDNYNNDDNDNGSKKRHQEGVQQQKNSTRQEHDQQGKKSSPSYTNSSSQMNNSHSNRSSRESDDTMPFIQSPISIFQPNPNLQIAYDARTKNPLYVMERLCYRNNTKTAKNNNNNNNNDNNKRFQFYEPKSLPPQHRTRNGYYRKSGFDRGHIAPAADFTYDDGYKMDTFSLMNISPQYPTFNRVVWLHLENWVRKLQTRGSK